MTHGNLAPLYDAVYDFFTPREMLKPSEWAERHRIITEGEHKGLWINKNFAYLAEPMDTLALPYVESIILVFAPQTGKSQIAVTFLGMVADQAPGPAMVVMPTENKAKDFSEKKLDPLFEHTPRVHDLLVNNSTMRKQLMGMDIMLAWANSPSALSSEAIQYLIFDECDKYPDFSGSEADPIALGEVRTISYPNTKKIIYSSTPNRENGPIMQAVKLKASEKREYYAVCPACGHAQVMRFEQIKWPEHIRDPQTMKAGLYAHYECESCNFLWNDPVRNDAVSRGFWRAEVPTIRPRSVAFHLPAWYSRNVSLSKCAADFLEGQKDIIKKKAFVTQVKAEPWKDVVPTTTKSELLKARCDLPPQTVPESAVALTCGVDVQKYGLWFVVRAFARDYTSWLLHYGQITWEELFELVLRRTYPVHGSYRRMRIWRTGLDTGGSESTMTVSGTELTYKYLLNLIAQGARVPTYVYGTKGASRRIEGVLKFGEPIVQFPSSGRKIDNPFRLLLIDTDEMKDLYHLHVQQAINGDSQGAYLHAGSDADYRTYVRHIVAEEKRRDRKGALSWEKVSNENHLFDCEIIAMSLANYHFPGGGVNLAPRPQVQPPAAPPPRPQKSFIMPSMTEIRESLGSIR